jgi:hypothetical protein
LQAKLDDASFKLKQTVVRAPSVYTGHFPQVGILRQVLLLMAAWMNYVFPLH